MRGAAEKEDLDGGFDGLVLPGGESTVQGKLLRELEMFEPLKEKSRLEFRCLPLVRE